MNLKISTTDVHRALCGIAESAKAPLFTAYQNDLYEHDREVLNEDAQPGDTWLWVLKQCGTWMALVEQDPAFINAIISCCGNTERFFFVDIGPDGKGGRIEEVAEEQLAKRLGAIHPDPNRVPRRRYLNTVLQMNFGGQLRDTIAMTELGEISSQPGEEAYFNAERNRLRYLVPSTGKGRTLTLRDHVESEGCFRVTITSTRGHARIEPISAKQFEIASRPARSHAEAA